MFYTIPHLSVQSLSTQSLPHRLSSTYAELLLYINILSGMFYFLKIASLIWNNLGLTEIRSLYDCPAKIEISYIQSGGH